MNELQNTRLVEREEEAELRRTRYLGGHNTWYRRPVPLSRSVRGRIQIGDKQQQRPRSENLFDLIDEGDQDELD